MKTECIPANSFKLDGIYREVLCGCGEAFADRSAFREHNLLDHDGQYIDGSSHFLSKFTLLVLPAAIANQSDKSCLQEAPSNNFDEAIDVRTRTTEDQQELVVKSMEERAKPNQFSYSDAAKEEIGNIRLVSNNSGNKNYNYYCGNCKKKDFKDASQFIIHIRDICQNNRKSSHTLTQIDFSKEIQAYMRANHKPKYLAGASSKDKALLIRVLGTDVDHSGLTFECGACRRVITQESAYCSHMISKHQEIIDPDASHIILRFRMHRIVSMHLTDRIQWINDDEISYCPCEPGKKMSVAKLIKHVRQVHMGISPVYLRQQIPAVNSLCSKAKHQNAPINKAIIINNRYTRTKQVEPELFKNDGQREDTKLHQIFLPQCPETAKDELINMRLISNYKNGHAEAYCGNCKKKDFETATEFILHLRDICPVVNQRSSHFLTFLDYEKEIQKYMRTNHKTKFFIRANSLYTAFFIDVFGTTIDHSDLPLQCGLCKQIYAKGTNYTQHFGKNHQGVIDYSSSHIILRFRARSIFNMYLTERIQWINDKETSFCPCEPSKKMNVANLIKHVRQVHNGITPIYQRELICAVYDQIRHQGGPVHNTIRIENFCHQQSQSEKQQLFENDEQMQESRQEDFHHKFSDACEELINIRLVRTPKTNYNCIFYCGNCRKDNFKDSTQFIIHLRDVCQGKHPKSSHFLTSRDIKKEIEDYQTKKNHRPINMNLTKTQYSFLKNLNITFDHNNLSFECGLCRQLFEEGHPYYLHIIYRHSETIDQNSSHIIFRLSWKNTQKRVNIFISDRVEWVNDVETYYCPCKPGKKMTMTKLIKHVRQVHMGISPLYQSDINPANDQINDHQNVSVYNIKNAEKINAQQSQTEEQYFLENDEQIKDQIQQGFHPNFFDPMKDELINLRLVRTPMDKGNHLFYCGNCKMKNFKDAAQYIIHLRDICKDKHPKSSHFLTSRDIRKEIECYRMKKNHQSIMTESNLNQVRFAKQFLGSTFDHSDLSFECGLCRQLFQEGRRYCAHVMARHSKTIDSSSSHIILKFHSNIEGRNKLMYISDRVPWINENETYYCPCKPNMKMTMASLIVHVRQVHMGISPTFEI